LWDTKEEFFTVEGYNGKGFPPLWDTKGEVFSLWDTTENNLWMANKFFSVVSHNAGIFLPLYPTPQQNLMQCTVSNFTEAFPGLYPTPENNFFFVINTTQNNCGMQCRKIFSIVSHNATGLLPLYPTMEEEIFLRCGIKQKRFFPVVGYNGRGFLPLWDTREEFFFFVGYSGEVFFLCGIQWRKMVHRKMIF
jgi:hypothetical protein